VDPVTLTPAQPGDAVLLANLLELYIHDLSEVFDVEPDGDGRFGYEWLPLYWSEPDKRFPFLIRAEDRVVGFVLVMRGSPVSDDPNVLDVAEFFVLRRHRRSGVGRDAAFALWDRMRGSWIVRVLERNAGAARFWEETIRAYTRGRRERSRVKAGACSRSRADNAPPVQRRSALLILFLIAGVACNRTAERVARGRYLANGVGRCFWCHSPQTNSDPALPKPETLGAGDVLDKSVPIVAPNLTPDAETGLGRWTDAQIIRAVREGIGADGRRLRSDHPAAYYSVMTDDDAIALVAYLRSLRPIRRVLPRSAPQTDFRETVQQPVKPASSAGGTPEERGAYLVQLAECMGCHTTTTADGKPFRAMQFGGGRRFIETRMGFGYEVGGDGAFSAASEPSLQKGERVVASANLTRDPSGIPYYTPELFIQTIRSGKVAGVRRLSSAMPWIHFRTLTDDDLRAIFAYLRSVPPVRHHVNNSDPPTFCKVCGRRHGLGDAN
jgi:predicted acetyltransferase